MSNESLREREDPDAMMKSWHVQQERALNDIQSLNKKNIVKTNDAINKINQFIENITQSGIYIEKSTENYDQTARKSIRDFTGEESQLLRNTVS